MTQSYADVLARFNADDWNRRATIKANSPALDTVRDAANKAGKKSRIKFDNAFGAGNYAARIK
jgi:hypothetical protein